ncbi:MAG: UvrD-helicase domain-containing protein, partial [Verrucomicrobiota bacterium]
MNHLIDQNARDRFTTELEQNFSVIAPAGVGKTHAITQRIVALAEAQDKAATQNEFLSRLVIVTYTNKAASEMQQRAREALLKTKVSARTISLFNQAFFGTIHGFCMKLLSSYGYALGLPGNFQPLLQDDDVWEAFLQRGLLLDKITNQAKLQQLLRVMPIEAILTLARHLPPGPPARDSSDRLALDAIDFTEIQTFEEKGTGKANIIRSKQALAQWLEKLHHHLGYTGLPQLFGTHKKLTSAWKPIMEKLGSQLSLLLYPVVYEMAEQYRDFRLSEGLITYDDQVAFAEKLIWHTDVGSEIRGMMYRVILDEAQDTDPRQFGVLLDVVRSVKAERSWVEDANRHHPEPGRFCMVGDPQQSIYGSRADLSFYKRAHAYVSRSNCGEEVTFAVTFRCDQKIIDFVNTLFPRLLPGDQGQAEFVPLRERPDIAEGQVIRWTLEDDWDSQEDAPTTEQCMLREASMVARKLKETGLTALRAECWSEVAILCPRRAWLEILSKALRKEGFEIDLHSRDHKKGDSPVYAWFVSLMTCLAEPWREYEIVGLLREVFGFSDEQLYEHRSAKGSFKIQVQQPNVGHPEVRKTITLLHELRDKTSRWSLAQAVDEIVRSVQLQDRLVGIQAAENQWPEQQHVCEGIDIPRELDTLLMEAVLAEENELLFEEWVKELQGTFTMETPQETLVNPHALQLITCQKAKGLQWAAVVIPFLNAEIGSVSPRYPMAIKQGIDAAPLLVPQSVFYPDVEKETARLKTLQEFVRLSYVTLTRAKRTLILCDDFK